MAFKIILLVFLENLITFAFGAKLYSTSFLPSATIEDLKNSAGNFIKDSNGRIGVFAVTNLGAEYSTAILNFQKKAPDCLSYSDLGLPVRNMPYGSSRRTYATETNSDYPWCIKEEAEVIAKMFKTLETIVIDFIEDIFGQKLNYFVDGHEFKLKNSLTKDHLHVYSQSTSDTNDTTNDYMLPYHIDNGLCFSF